MTDSLEDRHHERMQRTVWRFLCGCGDPDRAVRLVHDVLREAEWWGDEHGEYEADPMFGFFMASEGARYFTLYVLTEAGLLEHGSSVNCSRRTNLGNEVLAYLEKHGDDPDKWDTGWRIVTEESEAPKCLPPQTALERLCEVADGLVQGLDPEHSHEEDEAETVAAIDAAKREMAAVLRLVRDAKEALERHAAHPSMTTASLDVIAAEMAAVFGGGGRRLCGCYCLWRARGENIVNTIEAPGGGSYGPSDVAVSYGYTDGPELRSGIAEAAARLVGVVDTAGFSARDRLVAILEGTGNSRDLGVTGLFLHTLVPPPLPHSGEPR